jgi:hypothetical protein
LFRQKATKISNHYNSSMFESRRINYITASDSSHEKSLLNLVASITHSSSDSKIYVWDLGMSESSVNSLLLMSDRVSVTRFDFQSKPAHFSMHQKSGSYAWKSWCILEVFENLRDGSILIWLDAGCLVSKNLSELHSITRFLGFFMKMSDGKVSKWTHPLTLQALTHKRNSDLSPTRLANQRNFSAAVICLDSKRVWVRRILNEWANLSLEESVISPEGSDKTNHRFDQSLLTIILYQRLSIFRLVAWKLIAFIPYGLLGVRIHQDVEE